MPGQLLAVARNAFVESIRQPFYTVWLAIVAGIMALNPYLSTNTFENDDLMAIDMGLSMLLVGGLILAAFTATGVISREIENRTALTVISKPLPRPVFIVGKYLGIALAMLLAWWIWMLISVMSIRQGAFSRTSDPWDLPVLLLGSLAILGATGIALAINYLFHKPFGSAWAKWLSILLPIALLVVLTFNHSFKPQSPLAELARYGGLILAMIFAMQATLVLAAVAVAASTRLGQVATLTICAIVFLVGLSSDHMIGRYAQDEYRTEVTLREVDGEARQIGNEASADVEKKVLVNPGSTPAKVTYAIVPNIGLLWLGDAITQGTIGRVTFGYVVYVTVYSVVLIVGVMALAVALFQSRQAA